MEWSGFFPYAYLDISTYRPWKQVPPGSRSINEITYTFTFRAGVRPSSHMPCRGYCYM